MLCYNFGMLNFFYCARLQIGCLVFLLYIGFLLLNGADKNAKCNVFYNLFFALAELCVVFDGITAWSVNNLEKVSMTANIILHGIFYILLEAELWLMYFYFRSSVNRMPKTRYEKIFFICLVVVFAVLTMATLPQIKIIKGQTTNYSYGLPVFIVFSMVPLPFFLIAVMGREYIRRAEPIKRLTLKSCFFTVLFFSLLQFVFHEILITSVNVSLIAIAVALNSENPIFHRLERILKKYEMEKNYYDRLEEIEQKQSIIRHDEKHYLAAIGGLCAEGKTEEIARLLKVMNIELQKNTPKKYVRNRITNALFNEKENIASKENVKIDFQVEPEVELDSMEDIDLIAMFGNLIDNAVRAEKEWKDSPDKDSVDSAVVIKLFETEGNFIMFTVENHFLTLDVKNGKLVSTKRVPGEHGLGLFNVERLCEKYGGLFDMETEGNTFISSICLPKKI